MPKIQYKDIALSPDRLAIVQKAVGFIAKYQQAGYSLTLRQLYYRFVATDSFPESYIDPKTGSANNEQSYKKLAKIINDARLAGLVDWNAIEDRTRELDGAPEWSSPAEFIAPQQWAIDKWEDQEYYVEVWVEKDALEGVVGQAARRLGVKFFSCRGFASATALWDAGQRMKRRAGAGRTPVILHLGDHDPSGLDMSRDIQERVSLFMDDESDKLEFKRIALNMSQIEEYDPPPNPAKATDARYQAYAAEYGENCWELDALDPSVIDGLIDEAVAGYRDDDRYDARVDFQERERRRLELVAEHWDAGVADFLDGYETAK